ncbi:UNVERIFIED_CONTAM: hypothetical protein FKN15_017184 [Acipenser sinensis]
MISLGSFHDEILSTVTARLTLPTDEERIGSLHTEVSPQSNDLFHDFSKSPSPPSSGSQSSGQPSFESQPLDVATVPDQDAKPAPLEPLSSSCPPSLPLAHHAPQDYAGVLNVAMAPPATKPGVISHLYNPYTAEQGLGQWNGPPHSQYGSSGYPAHHVHSEYSAQSMHHGYHHGNVADWSQYPLFSYSCW